MDKNALHITIDQIRENIANRAYSPSDHQKYTLFKHDCLAALGLNQKKNADAIFEFAVRRSNYRGPGEILHVMIELANLLWLVGPTFNEGPK